MIRTRIVCGLGNPGEKYRSTRHNLGFLLLDRLTTRFSLGWSRAAREYWRSDYVAPNLQFIFIKPDTYMNLSGRAIQALARDHSFTPNDLLVVCDDFVLPLGRLRLRRKGSDGGHKGLASIIEVLGTEDFPRLRLGVGPVPGGVDPADFVLSRFLREEQASKDRMLERGADCIETLTRTSFEDVMGEFNAFMPDGESD
jgi:PTH1 family peptidyl-tRNA hydrolase